jgi:hypothetical protein
MTFLKSYLHLTNIYLPPLACNIEVIKTDKLESIRRESTVDIIAFEGDNAKTL